MNEVRLTLESFLSLCKLTVELTQEKERLRKVVVMQNAALEKLTNRSRWAKEYKEWQASTADLDMRDKHESAFWPPRGMVP